MKKPIPRWPKITKADHLLPACSITIVLLFLGTLGTYVGPLISISKGRGVLVVDLRNDGLLIARMDQDQGTYFDWDGDQFQTASDWLGPNDAFLVRYSQQVPIDRPTPAGSMMVGGFDRSYKDDIRLLDADRNGRLTAGDPVWPELYLWADKNADGYIQRDEASRLAETTYYISLQGGTIVFNGGQIAHLQSFLPRVSKANTRFIGVVDHAATASLPNLRGFGGIPDLHAAMTMRPTLVKQVQALCLLEHTKPGSVFSGSNDVDARVNEILFNWGDLEEADPRSRGRHMDGRKLYFMEKFFATHFKIRERAPVTRLSSGLDSALSLLFYGKSRGLKNPSKARAKRLEMIWTDLHRRYRSFLLAQCPAVQGIIGPTSQDSVTGDVKPSSTEISDQAIKNLMSLEDGYQDKSAYWANVGTLLLDIYGDDEVRRFEGRLKGLREARSTGKAGPDGMGSRAESNAELGQD